MPNGNDRSGTTIPVSCRSARPRHVLGMGLRLPRHGAAYATDRGRRVLRGQGPLLALACGTGLQWTIEGVDEHPDAGPGDPREQSRLVSRPADARVRRRPPRPARPLPRQGRAVRQARARLAAAGRAPDPGAAAARRSRCDALDAAVDALARGECVAVFPEGTISLDLEPMAGKSGTARLAQAAGVPVVPVGLWGTHRIMFKGRKPHWRWGVAEVAVVGEPRARRRRRTRQGRDRPDHGRDLRVCGPGPRDLSAARRAGRRRVVVARAPETADVGARRRRVTRVAVIGAGSWGTAVAAIVAGNAPTTLWARRPGARRARSTTTHENPDYLPGHRACPSRCARTVVARGRVHRRRRRRRSACRRTGCARCSPTPGRSSRPTRADRQPAEGHRAGHARAA